MSACKALAYAMKRTLMTSSCQNGRPALIVSLLFQYRSGCIACCCAIPHYLSWYLPTPFWLSFKCIISAWDDVYLLFPLVYLALFLSLSFPLLSLSLSLSLSPLFFSSIPSLYCQSSWPTSCWCSELRSITWRVSVKKKAGGNGELEHSHRTHTHPHFCTTHAQT